MNVRERCLLLKGIRGFSEEATLERSVDGLLNWLYVPNAEAGWRADGTKLKRLGLTNEPVNWGDLHCVGVEKFADGGFLITIEEASPGACPKLCAWVVSWLRKWGWDNVRVETEW